jgi:chorismate mutase
MTADVASDPTTAASGPTPAEPPPTVPHPAQPLAAQPHSAQPHSARPLLAGPPSAQPPAAEPLEPGAGTDRADAAPARPGPPARETGTDTPLAADEIRAMRTRIDEIDQAIIDLWQERSHLSQQVGKTRMASGGTRLVLSREREIVERFRQALGPDGTQVALLLLRSGRGPL